MFGSEHVCDLETGPTFFSIIEARHETNIGGLSTNTKSAGGVIGPLRNSNNSARPILFY